MDVNKNSLFASCTLKDGYLYYITETENIFQRMNLKDYKVEYLDDPIGFDRSKWSATAHMISYLDKIYFLDHRGQYLIEYSFANNKCKYLSLSGIHWICDNFVFAEIYNHQLYLISRYENQITKIDLNQWKIVEERIFCNSRQFTFKKGKSDFPEMFLAASIRLCNDVWLFSQEGGDIWKYSLCDEALCEYKLPSNVHGCIDSAWSEGWFYILSKDGKLFKYDKELQKAEVLWIGDSDEIHYPSYGKIILVNERAWILPIMGKDIWQINLKTGEATKYLDYPKKFAFLSNWGKYWTYVQDENAFYFSMHSENYILTIDKKTGNIRWIKPIEADDERKKYYFRNSNRVLKELGCNLPMFLELLKTKNGNVKSKKQIQMNVGDKIYESL